MLQPYLSFTQLVELLDEHLRLVNQAAHSSSQGAIDDVTQVIGPQGVALVELWRLLWPAISSDESRRQIVMDAHSPAAQQCSGEFNRLAASVSAKSRIATWLNNANHS